MNTCRLFNGLVVLVLLLFVLLIVKPLLVQATTVSPNTLDNVDAIGLGTFSGVVDTQVVQSSPTISTTGWVFECVDCPKYFSDMTNRSLRLDVTGHPHIVYGGDHLYYTWYDGVAWHYETVDDAPGVGSTASLALDGNGYPYISYWDGDNQDLKYAYWDGSGWHIQTVDSKGCVGQYTSLALDRNGYPHISYHDNSNGSLKYAYYNASGWYTQTIDSMRNAGLYTSLALDRNGYPHISYYDNSNYDLKYAYYDISGWHIEIVDSVGQIGNFTSLALDENGYSHISYSGAGDLKYAYQDGSGWHVQTVDDDFPWYPVGFFTSLALDGSGYPHISYQAGGPNYDLKYAYQDGSGWHIQTVDSIEHVGSFTSLALDGRGYPRISYYNDTNRDLKYAYWDGSDWHIQTVDSGGKSVGQFPSLKMDRSGYPHVSYYNETNGDLRYAYRDSIGWHIQTVDSTQDAGLYASLALDSDDYPHISYYNETSGAIKYAYQDSAGWHIQIVDDSTEGIGDATSLALDRNGYPHISYYRSSGLKYAYWEGSNWHIQTVITPGVGFASLALDESDYPHFIIIPYQSALKYAYYDATGWHIQTMDTLGSVSPSALALDGSGYPHFGYLTNSYCAYLEYIYQDVYGWHIQSIQSLGCVRNARRISLALGENGYPHFIYRSEDDNYLKYAYRDATGWYTQTVDSTGNFDISSTSLALDRDGYPHIIYHDVQNADLGYAWYSPTFSLPAPTLYPISNLDGDENYLVDWGDVTNAVTYTLEEDENTDFANPNTRYIGNTSQHIVSRQPVGTWYYRVKASNTEGDSPWSNIQSIGISLPNPGDVYEPDDLCSQASVLNPDGTVQAHTFHQLADQDWAQFTAVSGTTYIVQAASTSTGADLNLELHDHCDHPVLTDTNALGRSASLVFQAPADGMYYVKVLNHVATVYGPAVTYDLGVRAQLPGGVVLIVAGHNDDYQLQDNILYAANLAYRTFLRGGIPKANIRYLSAISDPARTDADGDGVNDVYASSASANVATALTGWAGNLINGPTPFYLYLVDHGLVDLFLADGNGDTLTPTTLDGWLTPLESRGARVSVIYEGCHSGSFIDGSATLTKPGRVIIASTGQLNSAYAHPGRGAYFSDAFFTALGQNQDLYTGFAAGTAAVGAHTELWQTPWLDDNGNGVPLEADDGALARSRGLSHFALAGGRPPVIDQVLPPPAIQNGQGMVRAQVRDDGNLAALRVWAILYPPSFVEPAPLPDGTMPALNLPRLELSDTNQDGEYVGWYEAFTERGVYQAVIYAEDAEGNLSQPAALAIQTSWSLYLPLVLRRG